MSSNCANKLNKVSHTVCKNKESLDKFSRMQVVLQTLESTLFQPVAPLGLLLPGSYSNKFHTILDRIERELPGVYVVDNVKVGTFTMEYAPYELYFNDQFSKYTDKLEQGEIGSKRLESFNLPSIENLELQTVLALEINNLVNNFNPTKEEMELINKALDNKDNTPEKSSICICSFT